MRKFKEVANLYMPFLAIVDDRSYMVNGYSMSEDMFCIDIDETTQDWWNTENFKPVLRTLDSITDAEKKELWQLIFNRQFHSTGSIQYFDAHNTTAARCVLMSGCERLGIEFDGHVWADSDLHHFPYNHNEVTRWLLIKQFDLFDLIKNGQAIGVNTFLTPTQK